MNCQICDVWRNRMMDVIGRQFVRIGVLFVRIGAWFRDRDLPDGWDR